MKLSKEQIQQVEGYLTRKGMKYIDIRFEVLDHISTDIENLIESKNYSFEDAFNEVKDKWRNSFKKESSMVLGPIYDRPSIFIKKCLKIYKPYIKIGFALILICGLLYKFLFKNSYFFIVTFTYLFIVFSFVYTWFLCYWFFEIRKTKLKTSYSFLFNTQILPNLFIMVLIFNNMRGNFLLRFDSFDFTFFSILILTFYAGFVFYKNHLKAVSTYKKYQLQ